MTCVDNPAGTNDFGTVACVPTSFSQQMLCCPLWHRSYAYNRTKLLITVLPPGTLIKSKSVSIPQHTASLLVKMPHVNFRPVLTDRNVSWHSARLPKAVCSQHKMSPSIVHHKNGARHLQKFVKTGGLGSLTFQLLLPQHITVPSVLMAQLWLLPDDTCTKVPDGAPPTCPS